MASGPADADADGVAIRLRLRDGIGAGVAARARAIFDNNGLAEFGLQIVGDQTPDDVRRGARSKRHDQFHGLRRPVLRGGGQGSYCDGDQRGGQGGDQCGGAGAKQDDSSGSPGRSFMLLHCRPDRHYHLSGLSLCIPSLTDRRFGDRNASAGNLTGEPDHVRADRNQTSYRSRHSRPQRRSADRVAHPRITRIRRRCSIATATSSLSATPSAW